MYWEVLQQGLYISLTWGEIGGAKKQLDRPHASADAAAAKLAELIEKQVAAGYVELESPSEALNLSGLDLAHIPDAPVVQSDDEPAPATSLQFASSPELELQCRQAPDEPGPWIVYGDWLMGQGDIRGELAALRRAHKERETLKLVATHYHALFGEHAGALRDIAQGLEWRNGFVKAARLQIKDPDAATVPLDAYVRGFLASPIALFVDTLQLGLARMSGNDWGPTLKAITESAQAPFVRELRFDLEQDWEISWTSIGDLDGWVALPRLEVLRIRAGDGGTLGTVDLPSLRVLAYESCGIPAPQIESIARASWPALEQLELWLGATERGAITSIAPLQPILDARELPVLRHLGLCNTDQIDALIPALAESAILPRLRTLDLSRSTLFDADALVAAATAFRHLDWIALEQNVLSDEQCARIRAVLPNARLDEQRFDSFEDDPEDAQLRYVALWE